MVISSKVLATLNDVNYEIRNSAKDPLDKLCCILSSISFIHRENKQKDRLFYWSNSLRFSEKKKSSKIKIKLFYF